MAFTCDGEVEAECSWTTQGPDDDGDWTRLMVSKL